MNFAVYSKDGCPYCDKIVQLLELGQLKHVVYKLDQHFDKKAFYDEFEKRLTEPDEEESTEFDAKRHAVEKGSIRPGLKPYGLSSVYRL